MEEFYYEETNAKHAILKCLVCIFIIGIVIGVFLFYKKQNTIGLKNITVEVSDTLSKNIEDYLENGHKFKTNTKFI